MSKTRPPLGVVPFEDRLAPAAHSQIFLTPAGTSWLGAAQTFLQQRAAMPEVASSDVQEWRLERLGVAQVTTVIDVPAANPRVATPRHLEITQLKDVWGAIEIRSKAPEATPAATPGPDTSAAGTRGPDRDTRPVSESRGSSFLGPVSDASSAAVVSALSSQADAPPADSSQAAPAADHPAQTTAGPAPVVAPAAPAGRPLFASTDYVFLEPESAEPPQAGAPPLPNEPLQPDEPQVVPAIAGEPAVAAEAAPASPLAGLLPFNVSDLEGTAHDLLTRVAGIGNELVEELGAGSEYTWLGVGALAAAGAVYASRPNRRARALTGSDGYDSVFARWEGANAVIPPR